MESKNKTIEYDALRFLVAILAWFSFFGAAWILLAGWIGGPQVWFFLVLFLLIGVATSWPAPAAPPTGGETETKHEVHKG